MKKAQLSLEMVMLTGFILTILVGSIYIFQEFASGTSDKVTETKIKEIANTILTNAKELYYLGEGSKKVVLVEMPEGVVDFGVWNGSDGRDEYMLVFDYETSTGQKRTTFKSDILLKCMGDRAECGMLGRPSSSAPQAEKTAYVQKCATVYSGANIDDANSFDCYYFPKKDFSQGKKHFSIEITKCSSKVCAAIDEVSDELSG